MRAGPSSRSPLVALIAADSLSRVGTAMTMTALPWLVLVTTGSAARTGLTVFVEAVGTVVALLFGGVFVDRWPVGLVSPVGDLVAGVAVGLIAGLSLTGGLSFWLLLSLVFVTSLCSIPAGVARYSTLPDVADGAGVRFERANAIFDGSLTVASLVGPALAGVLIAVIGASNVLWFDAATFGLSAMIVILTLSGVRREASETEVSNSYLAQLRAGVRFVVSDSVLRPLILFLAVANLAIGPVESVFVPVLARDHFHSSYALGWMTSAVAIGALGGNAVFGVIGQRLSRRGAFAAGFLSVPLLLGVLASGPRLMVAIIFLAVAGLGLSVMNLLEYTIYFERLPGEMRARGLGMTGALSWGAVPVGRALAGAALAVIGFGATLGAFAILFMPLSLAALVARPLRPLDQRTATVAEPGPP